MEIGRISPSGVRQGARDSWPMGWLHPEFLRRWERIVEVRIIQDWTHLLVTLKGEHSKSRSVVASLLICDTTVLAYEFENEPFPGARETMHAHRGYTRLELTTDGSVLSGDYYSGRDRQTIGSIHLERARKRRPRRN